MKTFNNLKVVIPMIKAVYRRHFIAVKKAFICLTVLIFLLEFNLSQALAAGVTTKLDTANGSTSFEVKDSGDVQVGRIDSDGNLLLIGSATALSGIAITSDGGSIKFRSPTQDSGSRNGLEFQNNSLAYFIGDDHATQVYGYLSRFFDTRTYAASIRVFGPAAGSWGIYSELTHNGINGVIATDAGAMLINSATGRVGINTTAPATTLHVFNAAGSTGPQMIVSSGTTKLFEINGASIVANVPIFQSGGSSTLDITASTQNKTGGLTLSGSLGIGTATPAGRLHIETSGETFPSGWNDNLKLSGVYPALWFKDTSDTKGYIVAQNSDNLYFMHESADSIVATPMLITGSNRIAIGTDSPSSRLHVYEAAGANGAFMIVSTATTKLFEVAGTSVTMGPGDEMTVKGGFVGIGTTNPAYPLEVGRGIIKLGGTGTSSSLILGTWDGANEGSQITFAGAGTNKSWDIDNVSGNSRMFWQDEAFHQLQVVNYGSGDTGMYIEGNSGIGTALPGAILHVSSATGTNMPLLLVSTGATHIFEVGGTSVTLGAGNEMVVKSGFVGVGTLTPSVRLHVSMVAGQNGPILLVSSGTTKLLEVTGSSMTILGSRFPKTWYKTSSTGNGATPLTACAAGYHMCKTHEFATEGRGWDSTVGDTTPYDAGDAWVDPRGFTTGAVSCTNWTATGSGVSGSVMFMDNDGFSSGTGTDTCNLTRATLCCSD